MLQEGRNRKDNIAFYIRKQGDNIQTPQLYSINPRTISYTLAYTECVSDLRMTRILS